MPTRLRQRTKSSMVFDFPPHVIPSVSHPLTHPSTAAGIGGVATILRIGFGHCCSRLSDRGTPSQGTHPCTHSLTCKGCLIKVQLGSVKGYGIETMLCEPTIPSHHVPQPIPSLLTWYQEIDFVPKMDYSLPGNAHFSSAVGCML